MYKRCLVACVVLWLLASVACAAPFINPPDGSANPYAGDWDSQFPYQRNVLLDFGSDPAQWPDDSTVDPGDQSTLGRRELIPDYDPTDPTANYHLEGYDDPILFPTDWFIYESSGTPLTWWDVDPTGTTGRTGMVGVYRAQEETVIDLTLKLDNWDYPNAVKSIWEEWEWYWTGTSLAVDHTVTSSDGTEADFSEGPLGTILPGEWLVTNWWSEIYPNPEWEIIKLSITVPVGGTVLIDSWHVATECTPELPPLGLLGLGCVGLVLVIRRKR